MPFAKNMSKNTVKNINKIESGKYRQILQKQQTQLMILLIIKFLLELRKSQEVHHRITQKQL